MMFSGIKVTDLNDDIMTDPETGDEKIKGNGCD